MYIHLILGYSTEHQIFLTMLVDFNAAKVTGEIAAKVAECRTQWNDSDPPFPSPTSRTWSALLDGWELLVALEHDEEYYGLLAALSYEQFATPRNENRKLEMSLNASYAHPLAQFFPANEYVRA